MTTENLKDKNISNNIELPKQYNSIEVEQALLLQVNEENYFADRTKTDSENFCIIMPPPNVTGSLHLGHALVTTLQDALARHNRLMGKNVLWQPGLDHAGIATQVLVERKLEAQGKSRHSLGREEFLKEVYKWKEESGNTIISQIKKLGSSADFSYLAFTMDEQSIAGVNEAFVRLYNEGLIYQDSRLVNWDYKLQTAISDLEVEQKDVNGNFYYLKYTIKDSKDFLIIATTRPETIFADTAIAVNPEDERYKNLIGKTALIPIINKEIKIIGDSYVSIEKGSGALKVTPAHDFNDFEIGKRHKLEIINILNKDGTLNNLVPKDYIGLNIKDARTKIIEHLKEINAIDKIEAMIISTPFGDRSGVVIEPLLTKQWFLNAGELAKEAIKVVKTQEIKFYPENWENLYFTWMENIQPWCISRQLWWGHRIPVYYGPDNKIFVAQSSSLAQELAYKHYGKNVELVQDNDVLDTWFSSGLWPFVTLGWPNKTDALDNFYPTSVLVTGFDIIFFWVARMVMLGTFLTKQIPFKHIVIHGLIRDELGQKMSKSKGNVIDPLVMTNKYGSDALRFALLAYSGQGRDIKMSENIIEGYRNFITKIYNAYKFSQMHNMAFNPNFKPQNVSLNINKWILYKLQILQNNVIAYYENYRFSDIGQNIYKTLWNDFCDTYIELAKPILFGNDEIKKQEIAETMGFVFNNFLKIIHPIAPFVSQYLYQNLHNNMQIVLATQRYDALNYKIDIKTVEQTDLVIEFISKIRSIRADFNIGYTTIINISVEGTKIPEFLNSNMDIITKITKIGEVELTNSIPKNFATDVVGVYSFGFNLGSVINVDQEKERLFKQQTKANEELTKILNNLNNPHFLAKAGEVAVGNFTKQKEELEIKIAKIKETLEKINK
jgi:valyl-tRNA synthetase